MYNLKLMERQIKMEANAIQICFDDLPSDDEWIVEKENVVLPPVKDWLNVLDKTSRQQVEGTLEEGDEDENRNIDDDFVDLSFLDEASTFDSGEHEEEEDIFTLHNESVGDKEPMNFAHMEDEEGEENHNKLEEKDPNELF